MEGKKKLWIRSVFLLVSIVNTNEATLCWPQIVRRRRRLPWHRMKEYFHLLFFLILCVVSLLNSFPFHFEVTMCRGGQWHKAKKKKEIAAQWSEQGKCNKIFQNTTRTQQERTFNWTFMPIVSDTTHCREFWNAFSWKLQSTEFFVRKQNCVRFYLQAVNIASVYVPLPIRYGIDNFQCCHSHNFNAKMVESCGECAYVRRSILNSYYFYALSGVGLKRRESEVTRWVVEKTGENTFRLLAHFDWPKNAFHITLNESTWTSA